MTFPEDPSEMRGVCSVSEAAEWIAQNTSLITFCSELAFIAVGYDASGNEALWVLRHTTEDHTCWGHEGCHTFERARRGN